LKSTLRSPNEFRNFDLGSEIGRVSGAVFSMAPPPKMPPLSQIDHAGLVNSNPSDRHHDVLAHAWTPAYTVSVPSVFIRHSCQDEFVLG
jgi:hypothetical protein